jgi:phage tail-like protein
MMTLHDQSWPVPKFYFLLDWGDDIDIPFQEVSGLDIDAQPINYRQGSSPISSEISMPGLVKHSNITMKKSVFAQDNTFWDWYVKVKTNTIERQNVVIKLMDDSGHPVMAWELTNAWPTKVSASELNAEGTEVAVESIEIAHEGLAIVNA